MQKIFSVSESEMPKLFSGRGSAYPGARGAHPTTVGSRVVRDLPNPLSGDFEDFSDFEAEKSTFFGLDGPELPGMRSRR